MTKALPALATALLSLGISTAAASAQPRTHSARAHRGGVVVRGQRSERRASSTPSRAATARAAELARVLATPCQNTELNPEPSNLPLVRAAVLCLVNRQRAQSGEPALRENAQLDAAAEAHVHDMLAANYFEHVSPSGVTPVDRVRAAGYLPGPAAGYVVGENLAWGTLSLATAQSIVSAWIASPGHLANIVESRYRDTGIAIAAQVAPRFGNGAAGATYAQEFGVIIR